MKEGGAGGGGGTMIAGLEVGTVLSGAAVTRGRELEVGGGIEDGVELEVSWFRICVCSMDD